MQWLRTGFGKSLIFQVFVIAAEMEQERLQAVLVLCPLQSIIELLQFPIYPWRDLRSAKFQLFGSAEKRKGARGTIIKCPERQLFFDSPKFGSSCNQRVTHSGDVDGEKVFPHYEVQLRGVKLIYGLN